MIEQLSDRTKLYVIGGASFTIAVLALMIQNAQMISQALLWIGILLAVLAALFVVYVLYSVYHKFSMHRLDREYKKAQVEQLRIDTHNDSRRLDIEQLKLQLEHQRLMMAADWQARHTIVPAGHVLAVRGTEDIVTVQAPHTPQLLKAGTQLIPQSGEQTGEIIPDAPSFKQMAHLISNERMPLCWTAEGPAFGTVLDLLSMAVTGKPGRGKTTALMYYVCMLLSNGAEVVIWDPHAAMAELSVLNNQPLQGMPETARVVYLDRKEDIIASIPDVLGEFESRDELYRPHAEDGTVVTRKVKHPFLLLADELPVLADFDKELAEKHKFLKKQNYDPFDEFVAPSLIEVIRKCVLEARKWNCYFIGSGQSFDAQILPTRVTENLSSRIVFYSSDRRARMSGLETPAIKELMPIVGRAGPGVMVFDCSRFEKPVIGRIPQMSIEDMLDYVGVSPLQGFAAQERPVRQPLDTDEDVFSTRSQALYNESTEPVQAFVERNTGALEKLTNEPVEPTHETHEPAYPVMSDLQVELFAVAYKLTQNIDESLKNAGCNTRYRQHAREIISARNLRKEGK